MKKNVMLLIGYLSNGGAERSITNLANYLSKYHNVILVVVSKKNQDYKCNVPIIEINELGDKKRKIIGILKLRKLKKKYKIDTTISYTTVFNFYNVISRYKDKVIISVRNHLSTKKEGFLPTVAHKFSIKKCDKIVCCSESVKKDQLDNYKTDINKTVTITNFCDLKFIKSEIKKKIKTEEEFLVNNDYVVVLARLILHKGHEHIIKAMSLVVKEKPNTKLLIFSRGPLLEQLEETVQKYQLDNNIFFMGFHDNPYQFLSKAKCFILASDYEGFPNVVIEAMACGTPIIATDAPGGTKEILMNEPNFDNPTRKVTKTDYGILIPSFINEHGSEEITENEINLSKQILEVLNNKNIYDEYHKKSLERIEKYNSDKVINDWLNII